MRIGGQPATDAKIALVGVERIRHGGRAVASGILATDEDAGFVLRLKVGQDGRAVGWLVIVGEPDAVGPVGAVAVGGAPTAMPGAMTVK